MNLKRVIKRILLTILTSGLVLVLLFAFYANSLRGVNKKALAYYDKLKEELINQNYSPNVMVISGRRASWHNELLTYFGAAKKSQHLTGNAIDIIVMDVNDDQKMDDKDVDIVTGILESLIGQHGGIGTYKSEKVIWNRQMVHFDCRGYRARWKR